MRDNPIMVDKRDAARLLSISLRTLEHLIARGDLAVCRIGRRCLIERRALEQFPRRLAPSSSESTKGWGKIGRGNKEES